MVVVLFAVSILLHAGLVGYMGLPWAFVGLVFDLTVRFLAKRHFRGGWLAISAMLGILAGVMLYAGGKPDGLTIAAAALVCIVRGGLAMML